MPIVTVEIVGDRNGSVPHDLAQLLADAVGNALESPPGRTWVRLRSLPRDQYAENESRREANQLPVFVTILKRRSPQPAELKAEIAALTAAVANVTGRPAECIHIEFAPSAAGRLSFGGTLVQ